MSCVSGGSWTAIAWTYLPASENQENFLGDWDPNTRTYKRLTKETLDKPNGTHAGSLLGVDDIVEDTAAEAYHGSDAYSRALGGVCLKPYGLDDGKPFTWVKESVNRLASLNDEKPEDMEKKIHYVERDRPFLISNMTVILNPWTPMSSIEKLPMEATPLYTGMRGFFKKAGGGLWSYGKSLDLGGGLVEGIGFNTSSPKMITEASLDNTLEVSVKAPSNAFTLYNVLGSTSAAPELHASWMHMNYFFPQYRMWPNYEDATKTTRGSGDYKYSVGDGGILDNTGLCSVLSRKVKKAIVFVNTNSPIEKDGDTYKCDNYIPNLFGFQGDGAMKGMMKLIYDGNDKRCHVLKDDDKHTKFNELMEGLLKSSETSNGAQIYEGEYEVVKNDFYNTSPYTVKILWVYLNNNPQFKDDRYKDDEDVKEAITDMEKKENFPYLATFAENIKRFIFVGYTQRQINLLGDICYYNIMSNASKFEKFVKT
eukprot:CAMPEP_0168521300 /NCGR_PEP_ID=MMETSP0405-20121227/8574_1 /TAXON_ID=498012 /ORGANISM="Trichosphaerium sp, Strain Am-I-7 wt" /LENGTH=480 /DNA_ID=CAMNT_0008542493 /DNA_START=254 /DNA_END=1696 /DNA_ORIENTATION=-